MDSRIDTSHTAPDDVLESPMIVFPDADLDTTDHPGAEHPFDAAERVLTAVS